MSPRPKRLRRVSNPPLVSGFRPYGGAAKDRHPQSVFLHLEEYEVIRLCDFENLNHHEAARVMDVSRLTLTSIYAQARAKIADAIVSGKQIIIEGGKIYYDSEWYKCNGCNCLFNQPEKSIAPSGCPLCGSDRIVSYVPSDEVTPTTCHSNADICVCPACGFEKRHEAAQPCKEEICPVCGSRLMRKN
ncbi:MAG: DUF134 domain-containing protein, partial [Bacteroidales bacterium]|nr:DUF134 domain-containing protein [Bacteroidales bacterium]